MRGKWNHSTKPSQYEVYDEKNKLIFSGSFDKAMKYMEQEESDFEKGYDKGFEDAKAELSKKFEKILSKNSNKSYEQGFKEGANQKNNKPCVCGFWNKK